MKKLAQFFSVAALAGAAAMMPLKDADAFWGGWGPGWWGGGPWWGGYPGWGGWGGYPYGGWGGYPYGGWGGYPGWGGWGYPYGGWGVPYYGYAPAVTAPTTSAGEK